MTTSFPPINYPNKPVPPFTAEPPKNLFPGFFPDMWKNITGKPYITVSSKGLANGLSEYFNDGADFGPDSLQADGSLTQTCGIQEAYDYATSFKTYKPIQLSSGIFNVSAQINVPGYTTLKGTGLFTTLISANDSSLIIFKNVQNKGFITMSDFAFSGTAYRGIDMSNFTSTNNGDNNYIHDIWFNTQYTDCQIDMDNNGQSVLENIWNISSGTTSTYSLRWNVNGESIRITRFEDGSTNGMLLSAQSIRMQQCGVNRITLNLPFQIVRGFWFEQGTLNGYGTSNPTFKFLGTSSTGSYLIQAFKLSQVLWQQGGITALFDLSDMLGALYVNYMEFDNVVFNDGDSSSTVAWTNTLPSGGTIGLNGYIPYKFKFSNCTNGTWGKFTSTGSAYTIPPFIQFASYNSEILNKVLPFGTPSVPASGTAQENTNPYAVDVYVYGGDVTEIQITRNGTAYTVLSVSTAIAMSGQSYSLNPGDSITVTYSTAPDWEWLSD